MTEPETGNDPNHLLHVLRKTLIAEFRPHQPDLTLRQLAVALLVYQSDELQTVRGLAARLNVSKSSISRALIHFQNAGIIYREVELRDARSVVVRRTERGAAMVERLGMVMTKAASEFAKNPLDVLADV